MTKYFFSILVMTIVSFASFGQTTKPKLNEVKNDPKTTVNAAKADGQVINKKNVYDSSTLRTLMMKRREQRAKQRKSSSRRSS